MVSSINTIMYNMELLNKRNSKVTYGLSSGEALQYGSDDATKFNTILNIQNSVSSYTAIKDRIDLSSSYNSLSDSSITNIKTTMESINTEVLKALSDTVSSTDRQTIASQIESLKDTLLSLVNDNSTGEYLFSGSDTSIQPFVEDEASGSIIYVGNNQNKTVNTQEGKYSASGINGIELMYYTNESATNGEDLTFLENEIIQDEDGNIYELLDSDNDGTYDGLYLNGDISSTVLSVINNGDGTYTTTNTLSVTLESKHSYFDDIDELISALNENDEETLSIALDKFERAYDNTNSSHALLGIRTSTIENYADIAQSKLTHFSLLEVEYASADLTALAIESQALENTYTALYSTINKINNLSLVNYLN